jgi:hypothetical protein
MMALAALIEAVGEHAMLLACASRADKSIRPASMSQTVSTGRFRTESLANWVMEICLGFCFVMFSASFFVLYPILPQRLSHCTDYEAELSR